jgi:DNA-binding response OmpR family regulator
MRRSSVLVVDDEPWYVELVSENLEASGYSTTAARDGRTALSLVEAESPDLVILDLILPDLDGYEVCRRIRQKSAVPIIMLTARAEEAQKVRGLKLGADDYVTKPFGAMELVARVEVILRRSSASAAAERQTVVVGDLRVDLASSEVYRRGRQVDLSPTEYCVLRHLAANAGHVLVQAELLRRIWGSASTGESEALRTAIHRLREKLEDDPAHPRYILTKHGIGYYLVATPR